MIGGTVARLSVAAGHHVVLSNSRGPETLDELVAELGPLATAGTAEQAAEAGELVLVSVPLKAISEIPAKPLAGKPVLDTGNYYAQRDGQIEELDTGAITSSGLLQRDLPDAHVVKVFNNIFFKHLALAGPPARRRGPHGPAHRGRRRGGQGGGNRLPGLDRLRRRRRRPPRRQLAPGAGHPRLRQPLRPVLRRDRHPRRCREDPRRRSRRTPLAHPLGATPACPKTPPAPTATFAW